MSESRFLIKLQALPATLLKKETLAQVFFCEFSEIFENTFFNRARLNDCFCKFSVAWKCLSEVESVSQERERRGTGNKT